MKHKLFTLTAIAMIAVAAGSCTKYDDTNVLKKINDLDKRVTSIEETIATLNSDIKSAKTIVEALSKDVYVAKVEKQADGSSKIFFTDGTSILVSNGINGMDGSNVTVLYDEATAAYYWAYTKGGETNYLLDPNGKKLPVKGEKGNTPLMRVTKEGETGYWEVSYDNGETYTRVLDKDGTPVTTAGGAGGLFTSVEIVENVVVFTFLKGGTIEIPLHNDLYIVFKNYNGNVIDFHKGASNVYAFTAKGVDKTIVSKPTGWGASLNWSDSTLTIVAPNAVMAPYSEQTGEVNIIFFGKQNISNTISVKVKIGEYVSIADADKTHESPVAGDSYSIPFTADGDITVTPSNSWISAVVNGTNIDVTVAANTGNDRKGTITIEAADNRAVISISQAKGAETYAKGIRPGSGAKIWNVAIKDAGFASPNKTESIAAIGEYVLVNAVGEAPRIFKASDGTYVGTFNLGDAPQDCITADDAGHIVLCNYSSNNFQIWRAKDINSLPELVATYNGGPTGRKISVTGDIYGTATVMMPYSAWSANGNKIYWRWQLVDGKVTTVKPSWHKISSAIKAYNQNIDMVAASAEAGSDIFYMGYPGSTLTWVKSDDTIVGTLPVCGADYLSNFIGNAVDYKVFNNQAYVIVSFDDLWGAEEMYVLEADPAKWSTDVLQTPSVATAYALDKSYWIQKDTYYQDVALTVSEDGMYLYAYYMFGGSTLGCVRMDCLAE